MKCITRAIDLARKFETPDALTEHWIGLIDADLHDNAQIILYPEFQSLLVGQHRVNVTLVDQLRFVSEWYWDDFIPKVIKHVGSRNVLLALGTAPYMIEGHKKFRNRAAVISHGKLITQDKLVLTPWETAFEQGEKLSTFDFNGYKTAILTCLDIEIPALACKLQEEIVTMVLVPTATETKFGSDRVQRCASARAIELCAAVLTSSLSGKASYCDLVSSNEGHAALYLPSMKFLGLESQTGPYYSDRDHRHVFEFNPGDIHNARTRADETNPAKLYRTLKF